MRVCCVPGCENKYTRNGIGFHHLPQGPRNEIRRRMWEKNIGRSLSPNSVVCDNHFTADQFEQNRKDGKKPLRWNAIPTIFSMKRLNRARRIGDIIRHETNIIPNIQSIPITFVSVDEPTVKCEEPSDQVKLVHQVMIPFNHKQFAQLKKETPPGCIPILPKFDPAVYVSVKKTDMEDYKKDISKYKYLAETYTGKVNSLLSTVKCLKREKERQYSNLKDIFNDDQLECLQPNNKNKEEINWGYKTINKAIELYKSCGEEGYKVILSQKLPYPSLELLRKIRSDVFDGSLTNMEHIENS